MDSHSIDAVIDFLKTYADRCHHGKEEDILFRGLAKKKLSNEHDKIMRELIEEHVYARRTVTSLQNAKESYAQGKTDLLKDVLRLLEVLVEFYPRHIAKEDKTFFLPSIEYFTKQELDDVLQEFWEFDRKMIHEKYKEIVDRMRSG